VDRALSANERGILEFMLADPNIPDGDTLRAQIPYVRVVDGVPAMPSYLHLSVHGAPRARYPDGKLPVDAVVVDRSGDPTGFILIWVSGGYLSTVEHAWATDEMPLEFPPPSHLRQSDAKADRT
jgi:hypothetical protein